jgi:hypothetical protein
MGWKIRLLLGLTPFLMFACSFNNGQNCEPVLITTVPLDYLKDGCFLQDMDMEEDEVMVTIRNRGDLDRYIGCTSKELNFNFDNYFMVAGRVRSYECGYLQEQNSYVSCGRIIHRLEIEPDDCGEITDVNFMLLVPRAMINYAFVLEYL